MDMGTVQLDQSVPLPPTSPKPSRAASEGHWHTPTAVARAPAAEAEVTLLVGKPRIGTMPKQGDYFFEPDGSDFGPLVLAYIDILGWSELICSPRTKQTADKITSAVFELMRARELAADRDQVLAEADYQYGKTVKASFFSDTMIFTCEPDLYEAGWLVSDVQRMCQFLLNYGFYTRGAIVLGDLHHEVNGAILGRALIEAYKIERDVAKYPRVIVTPNVEPLLVGPQVRPTRDFGPIQVRIDPSDGLSYLDILGGLSSTALLELKTGVAKDVATAGESKTVEALNRRAKYAWMWAYLERAIAELSLSVS
jgi:hypothetical protein